MRGLFGDFGTMPLKDLVEYLGSHPLSGTLTLERDGLIKQLRVREGMIITASSNEPREYLGQFLINLGHITEEQFNQAYEAQKETRVFIGKILTLIGAVSEQVVMNALTLKIRETLLEAFHWGEGNFRFDTDAIEDLPEGLDLEIGLLELHREAEFRETAWEAIRGAFPSGAVRLELHPSRLASPPAEGTFDQRLFALIQQGHTIDEIVLALHATDFFFYQRLYALYRSEVVSVAAELDFGTESDEPLTGTEVPSEELTPEEAFHLASQLLTEGDALQAEPLARQAHLALENDDTLELLRRSEMALSSVLKRTLMESGAVPRLAVPAAQLKELPLSAPERYLLSRIDGQKPIAAIIQVSPLRELEALKFFQKFIDYQLIGVD